MLVCNLFLRAFVRGVSSLCDDMYLVIYFFVPSRKVYLRGVINLYLRGVINLYFVRNKLCNFLAFILRLCTNIFCEAPPPILRGRGYKRLFVCSSSLASCVFLVLQSATPHSLDWRG